MTLNAIASDILRMSKMHSCALLVITGGEPLLQNIVPLVKRGNECGIAVSVETAGTTWFDELDQVFHPLRSIAGNLMVCSPKTAKVHHQIEKLVGAWKYVIRCGDVGANGISNMSTQLHNVPSQTYYPQEPTSVPIFVQPMDEQNEEQNRLNLQEAANVAMRFGYRLGVQVHKLAGLR